MATELLKSEANASEKPLVGWELALHASDLVRERMYKTSAILETAGIPYAVIGGNAVAAWVGRVNPDAARMTLEVDILLRREDLPAAIVAMEAHGFKYRKGADIHMFLEGPRAKARHGVQVLFAGEKVRQDYLESSAQFNECIRDPGGRFNHLTLEALLTMKLTSFRDKDRTHIRDLISVGLVDATWLEIVPASLAPRLKEILDNPELEPWEQLEPDGE